MWLSLMMHTNPILAQRRIEVDSSQFIKRDLVDVYRKVTHGNKYKGLRPIQIKGVQFGVLPTIGSSEGDRGFVTAFVTTFYLGDPQNTNMSNVFITPYLTLRNQYVLPIRTYIWTQDNQWSFSGDYRIMKYPQYTFGLGPNDNARPLALIDYNQLRFYQDVLRRAAPNLAIGGGVQLDYYYQVDTSQVRYDSRLNGRYKLPSTNELSAGITFDLIYDSRRNTINPMRGEFFRFTLRQNMPINKSSQSWTSIYADTRKYIPLNTEKHSLLALWALYWAVLNGQPFYLDLPSIGWDYFGRTGRGFLRNRYRSTSMVYLEAEYRTELTQDGFWGMVVFANTVAPARMYSYDYSKWYGAMGVGVRIKYNKFTRSNIFSDLAFSRDYVSWYVGLNEYF
jgi:hypothetical protein